MLVQPAPEKAELLRMVLSNCAVDAENIYPSYKKPFDPIFARAKNRNGVRGEIRTADPLLRRCDRVLAHAWPALFFCDLRA